MYCVNCQVLLVYIVLQLYDVAGLVYCIACMICDPPPRNES